MLGFVHPLVRHAVSEGLSETERGSGTPARHAYFLKGYAAEQMAPICCALCRSPIASWWLPCDEQSMRGLRGDTSTSALVGSRGCSEPVMIDYSWRKPYWR